MESLETKLGRLTPEQRKEAEDFVDFLLGRSGQAGAPPDTRCSLPPVLNAAPPLFIPIEPERGEETRSASPKDSARIADRAAPEAGDAAAPVLFHEIGGGMPDRLSHDYMDYGQFEHHHSPATEAVKKVRRKIIARDAQGKSRHLLDWVE